jgi:hypothetical protein
MKSPERRARRSLTVLKIAALILASAAGAIGAAASATAPAPAADTLVSNSPWWEKVTVTLNGDGKPESCRYETSLKPANASECDVASSTAAMAGKSAGSKGEFTRITFERRFTPGAEPTKPTLDAADTLLGGQVMALAIDPKGDVKDCQVVATAGAMQPSYSCDDAAAEKFQASLSSGGAHKTKAPEREGYMTIIVYGHSEHMV